MGMQEEVKVKDYETYEQCAERLSVEIENGQRMQRLLANDDFNVLFEEIFIKAWSITNVYNFATYDEATRKRVTEKMIGRSVFTKFIQDVLVQGNSAVTELNESRVAHEEDLKEQQEIRETDEESSDEAETSV